MGKTFFDQYSLLHFASGVIAFFWGVPLWLWLVIHTIFEILENTPAGMKFINEYITFWPGGKDYQDALINSVSDTIFTILGWIVAKKLDAVYRSASKRSQ